jgi:hypothetical protein
MLPNNQLQSWSGNNAMEPGIYDDMQGLKINPGDYPSTITGTTRPNLDRLPELPNNQLSPMPPSSPADDTIYNEKYVKGVDADGRPVSWNPAILDDYDSTAGMRKQVDPSTLGEDFTNTKQQISPANAATPGGSERMSAADWGTMIGQLAGPAHQFFQKKPEPFKYQKAKATTLDPTTAIILANQASREAQSLADYNIKQNAPTSGSYLANIRANALQSGLGRGRTGAGIRQQYDINNAGILNQIEQYNTEIENRNIDAIQQDEANWQTQRTNALYNAGSNLAGMRKDYKGNQINEMIAKNLGTANFKYDPATETFKYPGPDGQMITVPAATVLGTNPTNLGTGQMQQPGTPQFQYKTTDFDAALQTNLRNSFRKP